MNWALTGGLIAGGFVLLLAALLAVRLLRYRNASLPESRLEMETEPFSPAKYEPLARLAVVDDLAFLSSLPGYRRAIGAKLRRERCRIFRMYLRELADDFHGLHARARDMVAESPEANSEPVGLLLRQQFAFWRALASIELRLLAPWIRVPGIAVPALVESLETIRLDLARIATPVTL